MSPESNLNKIKSTIPPHVKLVAVSKFHPKETVEEVYNAGQRVFGESRVQELNAKQAVLPSDIEWHMIGHLQTNKIKVIIPYVHTIQSVDSWKLLTEINKYASKAGRKINCLLEIHIAMEDGKFGFTFDGCRQMLETQDRESLEYVNICGLMGMATYSDDADLVRNEFRTLKNFFDELKGSHFSNTPEFREISMGMSHDYRIAIEEGSTIVRIGTSIFGEREY